LMIAFGVFGWLMRKFNIPMVPVILGILLGELMEKNLRRALTISDGDLSILYSSPLAMIFLSMAVAGFVLPIFVAKFVTPKRVVAETHNDGTSD
jgi:putative tricarboxylic transport membrane protein